MNRRIISLIFVLAVANLFLGSLVYSMDGRTPRPMEVTAVTQPSHESNADEARFQVDGRLPVAANGGEWQFPDDHISEEQRQEIEAALSENIQQLQAVGILNKVVAGVSGSTAVTLAWPLRAADHLHDFGYHGIANFVDQNPAYPYQELDYACGQRSYDTINGYNHPGTDIFTWPFPWQRMDNNEVAVVAAAPGVIVFRQDGNYDRNCSFTGLPWNAVFVQHTDGSVAWYGHLKNGSLTPKGIGEQVAVGEYLGIVGSSGSSTGPHLHLELHDAANFRLDPYAGMCNNLNADSLWEVQPPYYDTAVNKITTGYAAPDLSDCSTPEQSHETAEFDPGDTIYFTTYYRDQLASLPSQYTIYQPDGAVYQRWNHNIPDPHYSASWWWWSFELESDVPQGDWQFEVIINGQTYTHTFLVGTPPSPPPPVLPTVITVTAPNGGEVITPGGVLSITWLTVLTNAVQVDLVADGLLTTITTTLPISGHGRLTWTLPISLPTGLYGIRVRNILSPTQVDESDGRFIIGILDKHIYLPVVQK